MAAISLSGGAKCLTTVTGSISGAASNTAYTVSVSAQGHTQTLNVTTNGSGAAAFSFVPWTAGSYTASITPVSQAATASATVTIGGHS